MIALIPERNCGGDGARPDRQVAAVNNLGDDSHRLLGGKLRNRRIETRMPANACGRLHRGRRAAFSKQLAGASIISLHNHLIMTRGVSARLPPDNRYSLGAGRHWHQRRCGIATQGNTHCRIFVDNLIGGVHHFDEEPHTAIHASSIGQGSVQLDLGQRRITHLRRGDAGNIEISGGGTRQRDVRCHSAHLGERHATGRAQVAHRRGRKRELADCYTLDSVATIGTRHRRTARTDTHRSAGDRRV